MAKFTNISRGPRGLHSKDGLVMVEAGETVEVDLADGEEAVEEWFAKAGSRDAKDAAEAVESGDLPPAPEAEEEPQPASRSNRRS